MEEKINLEDFLKDNSNIWLSKGYTRTLRWSARENVWLVWIQPGYRKRSICFTYDDFGDALRKLNEIQGGR